jgi:hypothetical protein
MSSQASSDFRKASSSLEKILLSSMCQKSLKVTNWRKLLTPHKNENYNKIDEEKGINDNISGERELNPIDNILNSYDQNLISMNLKEFSFTPLNKRNWKKGSHCSGSESHSKESKTQSERSVKYTKSPKPFMKKKRKHGGHSYRNQNQQKEENRKEDHHSEEDLSEIKNSAEEEAQYEDSIESNETDQRAQNLSSSKRQFQDEKSDQSNLESESDEDDLLQNTNSYRNGDRYRNNVFHQKSQKVATLQKIKNSLNISPNNFYDSLEKKYFGMYYGKKKKSGKHDKENQNAQNITLKKSKISDLEAEMKKIKTLRRPRTGMKKFDSSSSSSEEPEHQRKKTKSKSQAKRISKGTQEMVKRKREREQDLVSYETESPQNESVRTDLNSNPDSPLPEKEREKKLKKPSKSKKATEKRAKSKSKTKTENNKKKKRRSQYHTENGNERKNSAREKQEKEKKKRRSKKSEERGDGKEIIELRSKKRDKSRGEENEDIILCTYKKTIEQARSKIKIPSPTLNNNQLSSNSNYQQLPSSFNSTASLTNQNIPSLHSLPPATLSTDSEYTFSVPQTEDQQISKNRIHKNAPKNCFFPLEPVPELEGENIQHNSSPNADSANLSRDSGFSNKCSSPSEETRNSGVLKIEKIKKEKEIRAEKEETSLLSNEQTSSLQTCLKQTEGFGMLKTKGNELSNPSHTDTLTTLTQNFSTTQQTQEEPHEERKDTQSINVNEKEKERSYLDFNTNRTINSTGNNSNANTNTNTLSRPSHSELISISQVFGIPIPNLNTNNSQSSQQFVEKISEIKTMMDIFIRTYQHIVSPAANSKPLDQSEQKETYRTQNDEKEESKQNQILLQELGENKRILVQQNKFSPQLPQLEEFEDEDEYEDVSDESETEINYLNEESKDKYIDESFKSAQNMQIEDLALSQEKQRLPSFQKQKPISKTVQNTPHDYLSDLQSGKKAQQALRKALRLNKCHTLRPQQLIRSINSTLHSINSIEFRKEREERSHKQGKKIGFEKLSGLHAKKIKKIKHRFRNTRRMVQREKRRNKHAARENTHEQKLTEMNSIFEELNSLRKRMQETERRLKNAEKKNLSSNNDLSKNERIIHSNPATHFKNKYSHNFKSLNIQDNNSFVNKEDFNKLNVFSCPITSTTNCIQHSQNQKINNQQRILFLGNEKGSQIPISEVEIFQSEGSSIDFEQNQIAPYKTNKSEFLILGENTNESDASYKKYLQSYTHRNLNSNSESEILNESNDNPSNSQDGAFSSTIPHQISFPKVSTQQNENKNVFSCSNLLEMNNSKRKEEVTFSKKILFTEPKDEGRRKANETQTDFETENLNPNENGTELLYELNFKMGDQLERNMETIDSLNRELHLIQENFFQAQNQIIAKDKEILELKVKITYLINSVLDKV